MKEQDRIRERVSRDYAAAIKDPGAACCGSDASKGAVAGVAGYKSEELNALPPEAVVNAFGCGNPVAFSGIREGDTVLDLGSGAGIDLLLAAKRTGPGGRVIGVDMTDEMLAKAAENVRSAGLDNVELRKGIIEALPVEDGSVDWVISNCVINLSPEKERVFSEIARVLKPGGQMLVSDIVAEELPESVRANASLYSSCLGGAISESKYSAGLAAAGLEDVEIKDRLVYEASQLCELAGEGEIDESAAGSCCGGAAGGDLKELAGSLAGRIWSAQFYARKRA